jgi:1,4-alpha-glucan branching enzyme
LYEHADARLGEHRDWGTKVFNYGRHEVSNFLVANALFWMDRYHIDGLRVDAVASMLYLDYSRDPGEWIPNRHGGRENLEAIEFLRHVNGAVAAQFAGAVTIAEESTAFDGVTRPIEHGGLGFSFKWNMGWMNDTLRYMSLDPVHRRHQHHLLTFSLVYAWSENFVLPISHDEVVHGKASLLSKMPGDEWQKRANFRLLLAYMLAHPGKKLMFMGSEFGQWREWRDHDQLDWHLLAAEPHRNLQAYARELNHLYLRSPQFFQSDCDGRGFKWIDLHNADESVWSFERRMTGSDDPAPILCAFNATPVPRAQYLLKGVRAGTHRKILDSDGVRFGGSGFNSQSEINARPLESDSSQWGLHVDLPPLGAVFFGR